MPTSPPEVEVPVFVVQGANWECDVEINEFNSQFPYETQAYEAAAQAMEVYKGKRTNDTFKMVKKENQPVDPDQDQDKPFIGLALWVYKKGTNEQETGLYVPSHIALADSGFYQDSAIIFASFLKWMEAKNKVTDKPKPPIQDAKNIQDQIKDFEKLRNSIDSAIIEAKKSLKPKKKISKPVKKPRKKK